MAQFWRSSLNRKPLNQRWFKRLPRRNDGAKLTIFCLSKKILPLHRQTIGYASAFYIFDFSIFLPPCGVSHLLRQRTRLRNRPILLWLTLLQQRFEHKGEATHAAIYFGQDHSGNTYVFTKNGPFPAPKIMLLQDVENIPGYGAVTPLRTGTKRLQGNSGMYYYGH